jgi:opacity protein-like surface antigen
LSLTAFLLSIFLSVKSHVNKGRDKRFLASQEVAEKGRETFAGAGGSETPSRVYRRSKLLLAFPCAAQIHERISLGVTGGGVATDSLDEFAQNTSESRRYTLGPLVEFHWRDRIGVASGFLYQRIGERGGSCAFTYCSFYRSRGNAWSVPILLRWRFAGEATKPFVTGGYTYRRISASIREGESFRTGPIVSGEEVDYTIHRYRQQSPGGNTHGLTAGGGIEFRMGRFRVAPEARYTSGTGATGRSTDHADSSPAPIGTRRMCCWECRSDQNASRSANWICRAGNVC